MLCVVSVSATWLNYNDYRVLELSSTSSYSFGKDRRCLQSHAPFSRKSTRNTPAHTNSINHLHLRMDPPSRFSCGVQPTSPSAINLPSHDAVVVSQPQPRPPAVAVAATAAAAVVPPISTMAPHTPPPAAALRPPQPIFPCPLPRRTDHTYRDFSTHNITCDLTLSKRSTTNFPAKLHLIISDPANADIITWMPHGRSWKILDQYRLMKEVVSKYFVQTKYESFRRQINGWGKFEWLGFGS